GDPNLWRLFVRFSAIVRVRVRIPTHSTRDLQPGMLRVPVMAQPDTDPPASFITALTEDKLRDLRSRAITRRFRTGATLMSQGEAPGRVIVIEDGRAKVTAITEDGRELVLAFSGPGDLLGELSALGGSPRVATVRALEPLTALARHGRRSPRRCTTCAPWD